jgi:hypothetical protein
LSLVQDHPQIVRRNPVNNRITAMKLLKDKIVQEYPVDAMGIPIPHGVIKRF